MEVFSKLIGKAALITICIKKLSKEKIYLKETGNQHNSKTPEASSFN